MLKLCNNLLVVACATLEIVTAQTNFQEQWTKFSPGAKTIESVDVRPVVHIGSALHFDNLPSTQFGIPRREKTHSYSEGFSRRLHRTERSSRSHQGCGRFRQRRRVNVEPGTFVTNRFYEYEPEVYTTQSNVEASIPYSSYQTPASTYSALPAGIQGVESYTPNPVIRQPQFQPQRQSQRQPQRQPGIGETYLNESPSVSSGQIVETSNKTQPQLTGSCTPNLLAKFDQQLPAGALIFQKYSSQQLTDVKAMSGRWQIVVSRSQPVGNILSALNYGGFKRRAVENHDTIHDIQITRGKTSGQPPSIRIVLLLPFDNRRTFVGEMDCSVGPRNDQDTGLWQSSVGWINNNYLHKLEGPLGVLYDRRAIFQQDPLGQLQGPTMLHVWGLVPPRGPPMVAVRWLRKLN